MFVRVLIALIVNVGTIYICVSAMCRYSPTIWRPRPSVHMHVRKILRHVASSLTEMNRN